MSRFSTLTFPLLAGLLALLGAMGAPPVQGAGPPDLRTFMQAAGKDEKEARAALNRLEAAWDDGYTIMLLELARLSRPTRQFGSAGGPRQIGGTEWVPGQTATSVRQVDVRNRLLKFLKKATGQRLGPDLEDWSRWFWSEPRQLHPEYRTFKALTYSRVDERMGRFFAPDAPARLRLDEIVWGGSRVNGVPPLNHPATVPASAADWLKDKHEVFGVMINGEARAYPKRILAWHELARDTLGGVEITVVYCTLCGSVIPYLNDVAGRNVTFGTSGLLYRSNKLMFDEETMTLWSALQGVPVLGPLAGFDVRLERLPVVTTTWGEWRAAHPQTSVLSLDTGHERDYDEGAAYADYLRHDRLWFAVPHGDERLANKAEVLTMLVAPAEEEPAVPVALSVAFLRENPVFHFEAGDRRWVCLTTSGGANRVYAAGDVTFRGIAEDGSVEDASGGRWTVTEEALVSAEAEPRRLERRPAQRAFWFGWRAQYPDTLLLGV